MKRYKIAITVEEIQFDGNMEIPVVVQNEDVVFGIPDSIEHEFKQFYTKIFIYFLKKCGKFIKFADRIKTKQKEKPSFSKYLLNKK